MGDQADQRISPTRECGSPAPRRIGRYELVGLLGQGGMASVHIGRLAGPAGFEKLAAVKIIHPHLLNEREFVSMFLDEARLAACIQHPNVAAVTEMGDENGLLYMVGELVQGQSLRNVIRQAKNELAIIPPSLAAYITAKMCDGLHAAHELTDASGDPFGIVHRDVSPQNVLVSYSGHVKLIDFGVAQARDRITHTRTGTIKGKIGYLSPEQLRSMPVDRRSDIFSAGVVLYQLLTGAHPFPGESDMQRLGRIANAEFRPPRELEPSIPVDLERVVIKALSLDPAARFPSAATMAAALGEANRSAGERVGATCLATLMKWLFSNEISDWANQMETHRARSSHDVSSLSSKPHEYGTRKSWVATGTGENGRKRSASGKRRWIAMALAGSTLATGLALALTRHADEPSRVEPLLPATVNEILVQPAESDDAPSKDSTSANGVNLELRISPKDARLVLDGKPLDAESERLRVPKSGRRHILTVELGGYRTQAVVFYATEDQLIEVELEALENDEGSDLSAEVDHKRRKRRRPASVRRSGQAGTSQTWADNPFPE